MQIYTVAALLSAALLSACGNQQRVSANQTPDALPATSSPNATSAASSSDSLQQLALDSFELIDCRPTPDTLYLVSTSDFLFYPFGSTSTLKAFGQRYSEFTFQPETDPADPTVRLYRGTLPGGFVKLFADDDKQDLALVAGRLTAPGLRLANGLTVGMAQRAFFATFFREPPRAGLLAPKVVTLVSGLDGIRHYYSFTDGRLARIEFDSDYQFNKK